MCAQPGEYQVRFKRFEVVQNCWHTIAQMFRSFVETAGALYRPHNTQLLQAEHSSSSEFLCRGNEAI
jgi:hypothetical protein